MKSLIARLARIEKRLEITRHGGFHYIVLRPNETQEKAAERLDLDLEKPGYWLFCDFGQPLSNDKQ